MNGPFTYSTYEWMEWQPLRNAFQVAGRPQKIAVDLEIIKYYHYFLLNKLNSTLFLVQDQQKHGYRKVVC